MCSFFVTCRRHKVNLRVLEQRLNKIQEESTTTNNKSDDNKEDEEEEEEEGEVNKIGQSGGVQVHTYLCLNTCLDHL